jgi:hypothetical protein
VAAVAEIKAAANITSRDATDKILQRMAADGEVERGRRGRYGLPATPPN